MTTNTAGLDDHKMTLVWFIDSGKMRDFEIHAKMKQMADYTNKTKFFNRFNMLIVPAKENKFQILEPMENLPSDKKELENFLETVKHKLKDCLTVYL
jgi:hypothetical protein